MIGTKRCPVVATPEEKIVRLSIGAFENMCDMYQDGDRENGRLIVYTEIGQIFVLDNSMWDGFSAGRFGVRSIARHQRPEFKKDGEGVKYVGDGEGVFANPRPSFNGTESWVLHEVRIVGDRT
jgi:hypothetical protein